MQRAIPIQCCRADAEADFLSLNYDYLSSGWRFVNAIPLGTVGSSKMDSISEGYLLVLVIIEKDDNYNNDRL